MKNPIIVSTLAALVLVPAIACAQSGLRVLLKTATDAVSEVANNLSDAVNDAIEGTTNLEIPSGSGVVPVAATDADDAGEPAAASSGSFSFGKPKAEAVETVAVTAKGQGETVDAAKKDAVRNAIKMAVGELVGVKTLIENDELVEDKILTLSNAVVDQPSYGDARSIGNGLFEITVKAVVKKGKLNQELEKIGISTGAVAGDSLAASLFSGRERIVNAEKFLSERFKDFPGNVVEAVMLAKEDGSPDIAVDAESGHVFANVGVRVNMENYAKWAQALCELLGQMCLADEKMPLAFSDNEYRAARMSLDATIPLRQFPASKVYGTGKLGGQLPESTPLPTPSILVATPSSKAARRSSWPMSIYYLDDSMWKAVVKILKNEFPKSGSVEVTLKDENGDLVCSARNGLLWGWTGGFWSYGHLLGSGINDHDGSTCGLPIYADTCEGSSGVPFCTIAPALGISASVKWNDGRQDSMKVTRPKTTTLKKRLDLGEVSEDDLAEIKGYEVKVAYK